MVTKLVSEGFLPNGQELQFPLSFFSNAVENIIAYKTIALPSATCLKRRLQGRKEGKETFPACLVAQTGPLEKSPLSSGTSCDLT